MEDKGAYELEQRPTILIVSNPNPLVKSLLESPIINVCNVIIASEKEKNWNKEVQTKKLEEISESEKIDYLVMIDLLEEGEKGKEARKVIERIKTARRLAKLHSAKSLFVFPYFQNIFWQGKLSSLAIELLQDEEVVTSVLFIGQLAGHAKSSVEYNLVARMVKDAATTKRVRVPRTKSLLYPTDVDELAGKLTRTLFSFGIFGKSAALLPEPVSVDDFCEALKRIDSNITFAEDTSEWPFFAPKVDEKETVETNFETAIAKAYKSYGKEFVHSLQEEESKRTVKESSKKEVKPRFNKMLQMSRGTTRLRKQSLTRIKNLASRFIHKVKTKRAIPKITWVASSFFALIVLAPILLLFASFGFLGLSKMEMASGNLKMTKTFANISLTTSNLVNKHLLFFAKIPLGGAFKPIVKISSVLTKTAVVERTRARLTENFFDFSEKITDGETSNYEDLSERIFLDLDQLHKELGFLKAEVDASEGRARKILESMLTGINLDKEREWALLGKELVKAIPELVGKETPRQYLFFFQNNKELRPTGGMVSAFSLLSFTNGRLNEIVISDVAMADSLLKGFVEPPLPVRQYLGETSWFLRDANWDPDFPTSAERTEWFLDKEIDRRVDGVIAADLEFAKRIIELTGPVKLPSLEGREVTSQNIYEIIRDGSLSQTQRENDLYEDLTEELLIRLFSESAKLDLAKLVLKSLEEKHLQIYLNDNRVQELISSLGWAGSIFPENIKLGVNGNCSDNCYLDWMGVVEANVGRNSSNYYIERSAALTIKLEEGLSKRTLLVFYKNKAKESTKEKNYEVYVRLVTPHDSGFGQVDIIGEKQKEKVYPDVYGVDNRKEAGVFLEVAPGETKTVVFNWESGASMDFEESGEYRLVWRKQAGTESDPVLIKFEIPEGLLASSEPELFLTEEGTIIYNTNLSRDSFSRIYW